MFRFARPAITTIVLVCSPPALAETPTPEGKVTTIVMIDTPAGISREQIDAGFQQAVPVYQKIPGLLRKFFIVNDGSFGGMYLWKDRASAEAWYSEAWTAKAKATYGTDPQVIYFDSPVQIGTDNSGEAR